MKSVNVGKCSRGCGFRAPFVVVGELVPDVAAVDLRREVHLGGVVLGQRREAHGHAQRAEVTRRVPLEERQRVLGGLEAEAREDGVGGGGHEVGHGVARAVAAGVRRLRRTILEDPPRVHGALREHAAQGREVVDEQRARERLERRALEVGLVEDGVLLLEVEHRLAHGRVVDAGLVLGELERALAGEALLHLGERGARRLHAPVRLDVLGVARHGLGERLEALGASLGARRLEPQLAEVVLGQLLLLGRRAPGRDLVDGEQRRRVEGRIAGPRRVGEKPGAQHAERGRYAVQLEVVLVAGVEALTVAVRAIAREAREDGAVVVGQRSAARPGAVVEERGRPIVAEVDEREAARARDVGVDDALLAAHDLNGPTLGRQPGGGRQRIDVGQRGRASARGGLRRRADSLRRRRAASVS